MFTWNFQYISKNRLAEAFSQLMLDTEYGDVLVRIHTSIHLADEAVDLARYMPSFVPVPKFSARAPRRSSAGAS